MDFAKDLRYCGRSLVLTEQSLTILQAYRGYSSAAVVAVGIAVHTEEDNLAEDILAADSPAVGSLVVADIPEEDIPAVDIHPLDIPPVDNLFSRL